MTRALEPVAVSGGCPPDLAVGGFPLEPAARSLPSSCGGSIQEEKKGQDRGLRMGDGGVKRLLSARG